MSSIDKKPLSEWDKKAMDAMLGHQTGDSSACQPETMADELAPEVAEASSASADAEGSLVVHLDIGDVIDSPYQPRMRPLGRKDVEELMRSIAAAGQVSPIVVSPVGDEPGTYHVHSGHRRCAALRYLGAKTVLAVVRSELAERDARRLALADNIGREDLSAFEQATALKSYCEQYSLTTKEGGVDLGIRLRTAERLRSIAECTSEPLLEILRESHVSTRAADILVKVEKMSPRKGVRLAKKWVDQKVSHKDLEAALKRNSGPAAARMAAKRDVVVRVDDKVVELKMHVVRDGRSDAQDDRIRAALCEVMWHLGIHHLEAAPVGDGVA